MTGDKEPGPRNEGQVPEKKPWPLSWILIVILTYIALQTAFYLFKGE